MSIRFRANENTQIERNITVDKSLIAVANEMAILAAARGGANIGIDGDVATVPVEPYPEIDPITGEAEEPLPPIDYYRVGGPGDGDALGSLSLKP